MIKIIGLICAFSVTGHLFAEDPEILKLATTTSLCDSGLLDRIVPDFEKRHDARVHILSVGTGRVLQMGRDGDADILLVHDPDGERKFLEEGWGLSRKTVMHNYFLLAGPATSPYRDRDPLQLLQEIAAKELPFVSRADDSGTHRRERTLWKLAGIEPSGPWYIEAGVGMGSVLTMADEKKAYCLSDSSTFAVFRKKTDLVVCSRQSEGLKNEYSVILIDPARHPENPAALAKEFQDWILSDPVRKIIGSFEKDGTMLFVPE